MANRTRTRSIPARSTAFTATRRIVIIPRPRKRRGRGRSSFFKSISGAGKLSRNEHRPPLAFFSRRGVSGRGKVSRQGAGRQPPRRPLDDQVGRQIGGAHVSTPVT